MKALLRASLAGYVALAYTLVIVYASLQPFTGWRMPPPEVFAFLTAPWPRYITASDIALNVAAYLPLGVMLFYALRPPLSAAFAFILATLLAILLSLLLESVQMFLPIRIASNVDLISNGAGAALGALGAMLLTLGNNPLAALRVKIVRTGLLGDAGIILIALWIVIQFQPSPLAFGSGNLRDAFRLTPVFMHSSQAYLLGEAAIVALAVTAIGLAISLLLQSRRYSLRVMLATLLLTAAAKSVAAAAIARTANWFQWLTPGVAAGLATGIVAVALLVWLAPMVRAAAAIVCIAAGIAIVNLMPDNPYVSVPPFMSSLPPTHLTNFGSIVRLLAQCWPFAVLVLLCGLARAGPPRTAR
ncbi:MAG TPA: VanZ family protein [Burkholderiales bacterium]|nr:VanZ family protein [Burkholderiales bacterium]